MKQLVTGQKLDLKLTNNYLQLLKITVQVDKARWDAACMALAIGRLALQDLLC